MDKLLQEIAEAIDHGDAEVSDAAERGWLVSEGSHLLVEVLGGKKFLVSIEEVTGR
jgi:hypothetical protein